MWYHFRHWLIHLFTPHCDACESAKQCKHCDELFQLLERERAERIKLMELFTAQPARSDDNAPSIDYSKIGPLSWRAKREQLERDSFLKAHAPKDINDANQ